MAINFDMMSVVAYCLSDWELDTYPIYDVVDAYRLGAYERFSPEREEHIDLISYANDLDTFESKFDCRKYAGDVVKSRLRSVLESSFELTVLRTHLVDLKKIRFVKS